MGRDRWNDHPMRMLFRARTLTTCEGMNWLQEHGHVSDNCVLPEEVAEVDYVRVLKQAGFECFICEWGRPKEPS